MKTIIHRSETRGFANYDWLISRHSFSFAEYFNPDRIQFGALRVLNDDIVKAGMGFGLHPHANMEIISIPIKGELEHKDSIGEKAIIKQGEVQIMSAGKGIRHSEYNHSLSQDVNFLQIWILPNKNDLTPTYSQHFFPKEERLNKFQLIVSPKNNEGLTINQNAYLSLITLSSSINKTYNLYNSNNGVYLFVIEGSINVENKEINERDGIGIWDINAINLSAKNNCELLLIEVPMTI